MRSLGTAALVVQLLAGCGASTITNNADLDAPVTIAGPDAGPDARVSCDRASQCASGAVCAPTTLQCVVALSCQRHAECGTEAYCTTAGTCAMSALYGPCDGDPNCIGGQTCAAGHCGCGGQLLTATAVAPNMFIAPDRSDSMATSKVPPGNDSRWTVAKRAIHAITAKYQAGIRFGLVLWPGTNKACSGGTECQGIDPAVQLDLDTGPAIDGYLGGANTCMLGTPIAGTLTALGGFAGLADTTRPEYIAFVTDGQQNNCSGDDVAAAMSLRKHTPEVKTFVIGFGGDVDAANLAAIAQAGGTARPAPPLYYQADDETTLLTAFDNIAGSIIACTYTLDQPPENPDRLFVYLGSAQIARDPTHLTGWDYDAATQRLSFYGASCDEIRAGGALAVSFGCPIIP